MKSFVNINNKNCELIKSYLVCNALKHKLIIEKLTTIILKSVYSKNFTDKWKSGVGRLSLEIRCLLKYALWFTVDVAPEKQLILIAMHVINHLNTIILACRNTFGNSMV
jgi:hypothetical protein